jgi:putative oxidoreductase
MIMVNPVRVLARPMLASMFVVGGLEAMEHPTPKVGAADDLAHRLANRVGLGGLDTRTLVQINGAVQIAAGAALAVGKFPRLSCAALAASLVPTTVAGHPFWDEMDPDTRANQEAHFLKNVSMLGGLLLASSDREGRPSAIWLIKNKVHQELDKAGMLATHTKREVRVLRKAAKFAARATAAKAELAKTKLATAIA